MTAADEWADYLAQCHAAHPGITEEVLSGSRHPTLGHPYRRRRDPVPVLNADTLPLPVGSGSLHLVAGSATTAARSDT